MTEGLLEMRTEDRSSAWVLRYCVLRVSDRLRTPRPSHAPLQALTSPPPRARMHLSQNGVLEHYERDDDAARAIHGASIDLKEVATVRCPVRAAGVVVVRGLAVEPSPLAALGAQASGGHVISLRCRSRTVHLRARSLDEVRCPRAPGPGLGACGSRSPFTACPDA